jgi:hypothetical protein
MGAVVTWYSRQPYYTVPDLFKTNITDFNALISRYGWPDSLRGND